MAGVFKAEVAFLDNGDIAFDLFLDEVDLAQVMEGLVLLAGKCTEDYLARTMMIQAPSVN